MNDEVITTEDNTQVILKVDIIEENASFYRRYDYDICSENYLEILSSSN